jgi:hypothetical protein
VRLVLIFCLLASSACAAQHGRVGRAVAERGVIARVISSHTLALFVGDVAIEGTAYLVERRDAPGSRVVVINGDPLCEDLRPGKTYQFSLNRRRVVIGIREKADNAWSTNLVNLSCVEVE